jgi:hypothetical protein
LNQEDFRRERLYQTSIAIARMMFRQNLLTEHELSQIDIFLLEKYRPLLGGLQVKIQQKTLDFTALLRD